MYAVVTTPGDQVVTVEGTELRCPHLWTWRTDNWTPAKALTAIQHHREMLKADERRRAIDGKRAADKKKEQLEAKRLLKRETLEMKRAAKDEEKEEKRRKKAEEEEARKEKKQAEEVRKRKREEEEADKKRAKQIAGTWKALREKGASAAKKEDGAQRR